MANNPRQHFKRELERARNNLDAAMGHMLGMVEAYKEHHPDYSTAIENLMSLLLVVQENIKIVEDAI